MVLVLDVLDHIGRILKSPLNLGNIQKLRFVWSIAPDNYYTVTIFLLDVVIVYHSVIFFKMFTYHTTNIMTPEIQ